MTNLNLNLNKIENIISENGRHAILKKYEM